MAQRHPFFSTNFIPDHDAKRGCWYTLVQLTSATICVPMCIFGRGYLCKNQGGKDTHIGPGEGRVKGGVGYGTDIECCVFFLEKAITANWYFFG